MAAIELHCWSCQHLHTIEGGIFRSTTCVKCGADLKVCLLCEHYDTSVNQSCREPMAEWVKNKERANFCVYFRAADRAAGAKKDEKAAEARKKLDNLFKF